MKKYVLLGVICLSVGVMIMSLGKSKTEKALFAGGCFWCSQAAFENLDGVQKVVVGYAGGTGKNPTYQDYAQKGYVEAFEITYDPEKTSYGTLLDLYWKNVDPTDAGGQFVDRGPQYRTIIFYYNEAQKQQAMASKKKLEELKRFSKPIVTEIIKATNFYEAEEYHKGYYKKNPVRYNMYHMASGRDNFFKKIWGAITGYFSADEKHKPKVTTEKRYKKLSEAELKKKLTPLQYSVTQKNETEKPFYNKYWNNKEDGIYVDIVSGQPLFSSKDKFVSETGWPSFTKALTKSCILEKADTSLGVSRTEVRSSDADSHLGHVFTDGPGATGLRYCINSAALRFIPVKYLEKEGYGEYLKLFEK